MSEQEQYLTELLKDVVFQIEQHPSNSPLRKQLVNLLNRKSPNNEQPFKIREHK
ncbi:hypothetical protein [Aliivibrio fischeri]|uniref:hypothetical protein n=1 Tax=Aliivibrio fischeri TaxID=668 RepID=UPI0012D96CC7|nr:hypothetical protein [Aliivibrio fischeri]MUJ20421.1 hypothetical protein [Aliivibrio fischeri]